MIVQGDFIVALLYFAQEKRVLGQLFLVAVVKPGDCPLQVIGGKEIEQERATPGKGIPVTVLIQIHGEAAVNFAFQTPPAGPTRSKTDDPVQMSINSLDQHALLKTSRYCLPISGHAYFLAELPASAGMVDQSFCW